MTTPSPVPAPPTAQVALEAFTRHKHRSGHASTDLDTVQAFIEHAVAEGEARGWIATSERIPSREQQQRGVLVCGVPIDGALIASTDNDGIWWHADCAKLVAGRVTHWMPLPSPPEKGSK